MKTSTSNGHRKRLEDVRASLHSARDDQRDAQRNHDTALARVQTDGSSVDLNSPEAAAVGASAERLKRAIEKVNTLRDAESDVLSVIGGSSTPHSYNFTHDPEVVEQLERVAGRSDFLKYL